MSRARLTQLVTEFSAHPGLGPLAARTLELARQAQAARDFAFPRPGSPTLRTAEPPSSALFPPVEPELVEAFRAGASSSEQCEALAVLFLLAVSADWPGQSAERLELARTAVWLETYSGIHCLTTSDAVLDARRVRQLAEATLELVEGARSTLSEPEIEVARNWLMGNAIPECADLADKSRRIPSAIASPPPGQASGDTPIEGTLGPRPRHPVIVSILAVTGILLLIRVGRALLRLALLHRTPTTVWLSERGLELFTRYELLGKVVKERRLLVPLEDVRTVEREVRFPRLGLYAGLLALAAGTLLGTRLFVDGLRVAGFSLPLIGIGLGVVACGVALDLWLSGLGDSVKGRCRLVVLCRRGPHWAVSDLEPNSVDRLLTELSTKLASRRSSLA